MVQYGSTCSANSVYPDITYVCESAIDGNIYTEWAIAGSTVSSIGSWIEIVLAQAYSLRRIFLVTRRSMVDKVKKARVTFRHASQVSKYKFDLMFNNIVLYY